jgi:hypothetical protein
VSGLGVPVATNARRRARRLPSNPIAVFSVKDAEWGGRRWHAVCRDHTRSLGVYPTQLQAFQSAIAHCGLIRHVRAAKLGGAL